MKTTWIALMLFAIMACSEKTNIEEVEKETQLELVVNQSVSESSSSNKTVWSVKNIYGDINAQTLQTAINDAIQHRIDKPNEDIVLRLAEGTYYLDEQIEIHGLNQNGTGWLVIKGKGVDKTELVDTEYLSDTNNTFQFDRPYRVRIEDFQVTGERITSSQGTIVNIIENPDYETYLDIDIDEGYPNVDGLWEIETTKANKIRIFDDSGSVPHYAPHPSGSHYLNRWAFEGDFNSNGNPDVRPVLIDSVEDVWRFKLRTQNVQNDGPIPFQIGDRVGISSKSNRSEWARFKNGGEDFIAENISFLRLGRCKFRGTWTNVRFTNVKILRPEVNGKISFYSTDAGPQFGHDRDGLNMHNVIMENCDFRGTVDDGSAFQRIQSGYADSNHWEDGGGVLVGPNTSLNFTFTNNTHINCPLEDER